MDLDEELKLVKKAAKDKDSFQQLYSIYFTKIFIYVLNKVSSKHLAEDITSEVFLAAIEGVKTFDTSRGNRFGSWLYRVAHNKVVDYYKQASKTNNYSLEENDIDSIESDDPTLKELFILEEVRRKVVKVLKQLNPRYQLLINLKFYAELSNQEIAEAMDTDNRHVAVLIHRAQNDFKKKYYELYGEEFK